MDELILRTGVDNSKVPGGLSQFEAMVEAKLKGIQAKISAVGKSFGIGNMGGMGRDLGQLEGSFNRVSQAAGKFNSAINGMSRSLTGGLGIAGAVGGLALLEGAFSRAIKKAQEFQTAQLSIAAQMQSQYKIITGGGRQLTGAEGFQASFQEAQKLNQEIIKRSNVNILTYQEQLSSFRSGMAPGANIRGLNPQQILEVTEKIGVAAKAMGITGEDLANSVRLVMSGRQNLQRSQIGAGLGITNASVKGMTGEKFMEFISNKTKGFEAGAPAFEKSLTAQLSTFEANIDVWLAKVGQKMFTKLGPALQQFQKFLEGPGGSKLGENLGHLFEGILKGVEAIAKSPAIPVLMKFIEFLAANADKLVIGAAFLTFGNILKGLITTIQSAAEWMTKLGGASVAAGGEMATAGAGASALKGNLSRGALGGAAQALEAGAIGFGPSAATLGIMGANGRRQMAFQEDSNYNGPLRGRAMYAAVETNQAEARRRIGPGETARVDAAGAAYAEAQLARENALAAGFTARAGAAKPGFNLASFGKSAMARGGTALQYGLYGELGNLAISSMFPESRGLGALAGALPVGAAAVGGLNGVKMGGLNAGPIAGAGVAGWGIGSAIQAETNGKEFEKEDSSQAALAAMQEQYPLAAKITQLRAKKRQLSAMLAGMANPSKEDIAYIEKRQADIESEIKGTQEKGGVTFVGDKPRDFSAEIEKQKAVVKSYSLGYGYENNRKLKAAQQKQANLEIQQYAAEGKLEVSTDSLGQAAYNMAKNPKLKKEFGSLDSYSQFVQANQLIQEQRAKVANEEKVRSLQEKSALIPLGGGTKLEDQLSKSLLDSEASLRGKRADFKMPDKEFENLVKVYQDKIRDDFDLPTKRAEQAIQALTLAGAPEHMVQITALTIQTTQAKIEEMSEDLQKAGFNIEQLKAQASHQIIGNRILQSLTSLGQTIDEKVSLAIEEKKRQVGEARLGVASSGLSLERAQLAPALQVPGAPGFSDMASAIKMKVDSDNAPNPMTWGRNYEAALRRNEQLQQEETQLSIQSAQSAKERASLNLAKTEAEYKNAMETVTAMHWQMAKTLGGGRDPNIQVPVAAGAGGGGAGRGVAGGILIHVDQKIAHYVDPKEIEDVVKKAVPLAIEQHIAQKARTPK